MIYKYIFHFVVAVNFAHIFADGTIDNPTIEQFTGAYNLLSAATEATDTTLRAQNLNQALKGWSNYNNCDDKDLVRSILSGLYLRESILKLDFHSLKGVVESNHAFFKTQLGVSLLYGWTLNQYQEVQTPYYVGKFFSFKDHFQGLLDNTNLDLTEKTFFSSRFNLGWEAVEDDRWAFYFNHVLWLHSAIERVRSAAKAGVKEHVPEVEEAKDDYLKHDYAIVGKIPTSVLSSFRTLKKQTSEKEMLESHSAYANHLRSAPSGPESDFVKLQRRFVSEQYQESYSTMFNPKTCELLMSLPKNTPLNYAFFGTSFDQIKGIGADISSNFGATYSLLNRPIRPEFRQIRSPKLQGTAIDDQENSNINRHFHNSFIQEEINRRTRENNRKHTTHIAINRTGTIQRLIKGLIDAIDAKERDIETEKDVYEFIRHESFPQRHDKILKQFSEARLLIKFWRYTENLDSSINTRERKNEAEMLHTLNCSLDARQGNGSSLKIPNHKKANKSIKLFSSVRKYIGWIPHSHESALQEIRYNLLEHWEKIHTEEQQVELVRKAVEVALMVKP